MVNIYSQHKDHHSTILWLLRGGELELFWCSHSNTRTYSLLHPVTSKPCMKVFASSMALVIGENAHHRNQVKVYIFRRWCLINVLLQQHHWNLQPLGEHSTSGLMDICGLSSCKIVLHTGQLGRPLHQISTKMHIQEVSTRHWTLQATRRSVQWSGGASNQGEHLKPFSKGHMRVVLFFSLDQGYFFPLGFCYLARFLTRQH